MRLLYGYIGLLFGVTTLLGGHTASASTFVRYIKPKDTYDQKKTASAYYYRTEHTPQTVFVTGTGYASPTGRSYTPSYTVNPPSSISSPHSFVVQHLANHHKSYPSEVIVEHQVPVHHDISLEDEERPSSSYHAADSGDIPDHHHNHDSDEELVNSDDDDLSDNVHDAGIQSSSLEDHHDHHYHDHPESRHDSYNDGRHHHGSEYEKGEKSGHDSHYYAKKGDKGEKSYDKSHKDSQGKKGHYDHGHAANHHDEKGGQKKGFHEDADGFKKHNEEAYQKKGGHQGEKKHHRKGSKTTGYHNVYHKDEYKKDHTFYDEADHQGHFSKHGEQEHKHADSVS